ncbi:MAG: HsdR family type I site-specific deoxyribonuclease [Eubacteriales bacterium]|nr:HsdR family type I site-specific deoxyribonuclease [Eubacteriales bacterium]
MSVDSERKLQNRVRGWLINDLAYIDLGNLESQHNKPVREDLLRKNLEARGYSKDVIDRAITTLTTKVGNQADSLYQVNEVIYSLLRYGCQGIKDEHGNHITVHYIDWTDTGKNDFYVAEEVTVLRFDNRTTKRPDLVLYVNGIAVAMFELKRSSVSSGEGIRQMLTNQQKENIQGFFNTMQLLMAGNEAEGLKYGVIETPEKYYLQWREDTDPKRLEKNPLTQKILAMQSTEKNRLRDGVISLCQHDRLLMLIHDFIIFDAGVKKTARHNQFFAVQAAQQRIKDGEGGIIWNTQGSGKSLIMVWLTKWIRENITDSRVVIITDRDELDDQIESLFFDVGEKKVKRAKSCADLRQILDTNEYPIVCSLIHKYGHNAGKDADIDKYVKELMADLPKNYKAKGNIIGFIDECHRTNSGKLHKAVEVLMPDATLIGFTGTPLLKDDKEKSIETFGSYIHTYKFDEGVRDGVVLDLRYEARDVNQELSSPEKIDQWFELKTRGLTERAKMQLKQSWTTINKLYSSKERLERIAADIIFDMSDKARLATDRGTAMLVADSIYEACKYWEIFQTQGFTRCAVVTSYEPTTASVRTATSDPSKASEEEYKKKIYDRMLGGKKQSEFEAEVKEMFKKTPAKMKLLIVVDKLLTGFDAPSATYLYIDKSMRDHDLFQSICRVNRPDGEDKDYGYIVDYMDLFRNIQTAVHDYTSGAFDTFDKEDVEGLIKDRYEEAKSEMVGSLASVKDLLGNVPAPQADTDYIEYFCGDDSDTDEKTARRDTLYALTASLTRSFANCCDRLVSDYGYTEAQVTKLRSDIDGYNKIKEMIKLASCDYIDLKPYEADMRYILDTYIRADDSKLVNKMADMSLVELLLEGKTTTPADLVKDLPGDENAKAETIENNLKHEIVKKMSSNEVYYGKLSEMLDDVIEQRKIAAMSYEEYLRQVVELAQAILHPEEDDTYPEGIRESAARRAIYDYLEYDFELTIGVDKAILISVSPDWHTHFQRAQKVRLAIYNTLISAAVMEAKANEQTEDIFDIAKRQEEYDR